MPSLWREIAGAGWQACPIADGSNDSPAGGGIRFLTLGAADKGVGLLVGPGVRVRVNGQPVVGGFRVLDHRDEILVDRTRYYFSAESTPVRVTFQAQAGARLPTCPVCRGPIKEGDEVVRCPGCTRWYHQLDATENRRAKPCWTYAATCRFCGHPTPLTGEFAWRPELENVDA
jgi:hypothetical protein